MQITEKLHKIQNEAALVFWLPLFLAVVQNFQNVSKFRK